MIAYKGFRPGMICIDYQFQMGLNVTDKANCRQNGFHCAENPLDCLNYYGDIDHSEYYIVNAGGDIDEDEVDSKISCTELTVLKRLTKEELLLHGLAFMADHLNARLYLHLFKENIDAFPQIFFRLYGGNGTVRGGGHYLPEALFPNISGGKYAGELRVHLLVRDKIPSVRVQHVGKQPGAGLEAQKAEQTEETVLPLRLHYGLRAAFCILQHHAV